MSLQISKWGLAKSWWLQEQQERKALIKVRYSFAWLYELWQCRQTGASTDLS